MIDARPPFCYCLGHWRCHEPRAHSRVGSRRTLDADRAGLGPGSTSATGPRTSRSRRVTARSTRSRGGVDRRPGERPPGTACSIRKATSRPGGPSILVLTARSSTSTRRFGPPRPGRTPSPVSETSRFQPGDNVRHAQTPARPHRRFVTRSALPASPRRQPETPPQPETAQGGGLSPASRRFPR